MAMKSKITSFALLIFLFACPVSLTAAGPDKQIIPAESIQISCFESSKYFVVTKEVLGQSGTDCLIKSKSKPDEKLACDYTFGINDFEIKNEWAEYFAGLKGDLLILKGKEKGSGHANQLI